jgi:hypothetical protein
MTFQFLCPQGHLLEGEEAHMGMQCQCPQCGTAFIIPTIGQPPQPRAPDPDEALLEMIDIEPAKPRDALRQIEAAAAETAGTAHVEPPETLVEEELSDIIVDDTVVHIPCPNGHELETPLEMIGQRAKCPQCGIEFRLKRELSVEYLRQQEILERRQAKFWLQAAIIAGTFVAIVLLALVIMAVVL